MKAKIEQHRVSQGIQGEVQYNIYFRLSLNYHAYMHTGLTDGTQPSGPDPKEEEMKKEIETEKAK